MIISFLHTLIRGRYALSGIHSRTLAIGGRSLHYYDSDADGPPIVFLHGLGTSASSWIHVLPKLPRKFRIIAPDLPGFGFSRLPSHTPFATLPQHIDALEPLFQRRLPPSIVLVGHSLGGWLAMLLAIRHPNEIRRLILVNPAGVKYPGVEQVRTSFELASRSDTTVLLKRMWYSYPVSFRPFTGTIYRELKRRNVPALVRSIREEDFVNDKLSKLTMPVDLIAGTDDGLISPESIAVLREQISDVRFHPIERCGHVPQLERPAEFIRVLELVLGDMSAWCVQRKSPTSVADRGEEKMNSR